MKTADDFLDHILRLKSADPDYARYALRQYDELLPWLELKKGIRERLNEQIRSESGREPRAGGIDSSGGGRGG